MGKYKKLGKNVGLITIGNFASKIMSFFMLPLYTAVLSTAEYGTADLMTTTVNLLSPFFTLLISEAVMRFALDQDVDKGQIFTIGLIVTCGGFIAMCAVSPLVLLSEDMAPYLGYFLAYYFFTCLHLLVSQFVKGIENVAIYSISGVFQTIVFIALNLVFLLGLHLGVTGYMLAMLVGEATTSVLLWIGAGLNGFLVKPASIDKNLFRDMLRYSVPMIPNSISWWISNSSDKYLLTMFVGVGVTGVYSAAQRIPSLFATVSTIFMSAWQISAVEDFGSQESRRFYSNIYKQYSTFNSLVVGVLICGCELLASILFSNDFFNGWVLVPVLLIAFEFSAMSAFLGSIYTSAKRTKMLFVSTMFAAVLNIVLNVMLIPSLGAMGASLATLASYVSIWALRLWDTRKIIRLDIELASDLISYFILAGMSIVMIARVSHRFLIALALLIVMLFVNRRVVMKLAEACLSVLRLALGKAHQ